MNESKHVPFETSNVEVRDEWPVRRRRLER